MRVSRLEEGRSTRRSFASSRNTLSRLNEGDEAMRRRSDQGGAVSSSASWARASDGCVTAPARRRVLRVR